MDTRQYSKFSFKDDRNPYIFFGDKNNQILTVGNKYYNPAQGYDKTLKDYYVSRGQYDKAGEYLGMFMFNNPELQAKRNLEVIELKKKGEIENAILKRATSENQIYASDFIRAADSGDFSNPSLIDNPYYKRFRDIKSNKFATSDKLRVGFFNRTRDGMGGFFDFITGNWDAIPEQHSSLIKGLGFSNDDDAYSRMGIKTEKNNRGETECSIDINSDNFVKFCKALKDNCGAGPLGGEGYNLWGGGNDPEQIRALMGSGVLDIVDLYNEAKGVRNDLEKSSSTDVSSSTVYGYLVPQIGDLQNELLAGGLDSGRLSEIEKSIATLQGNYINKIFGGAANQYDWYTNYYNEGDDNIEYKINSAKERAEIRDRMMVALMSGKATIQMKEANGEFGALITLNPLVDKQADGTEKIVHRGATVWIKGLFADECKARVNSDTKWQAMRDVNDIEKYGMTHELLDGRAVKADLYTDDNGVTRSQLYLLDADGNYILDENGEPRKLPRHEAVQLIEAEKAVNDAYKNILYENVNMEGNVINKDELIDGIAPTFDQYGRIINRGKDGIKQYATYIANNLYTDSPDVTMDDIFGAHDVLAMDYNKGVKVSEAMLIYYAILNKFKYLDDIGGEE